MLIIGAGILGLALAEFFSRTPEHGSITIVDGGFALSGSQAAAANLATKGQQFARDPHFELKLRSKKIYASWLQKLIDEAQTFGAHLSLAEMFRQGEGLDIFKNVTDRDHQFQRVEQPPEQLEKLGLPTNAICKLHETQIQYQDEAWVDASILMQLLRLVLENRGVKFIEECLDERSLLSEKMHLLKERDPILVCTGAWTLEFLQSMELSLPAALQKSRRLTVGSTVSLKKRSQSPDFCLVDLVGHAGRTKVTLSGNDEETHVSSTTLRIENKESFDEEMRKTLQTLDDTMLNSALQFMQGTDAPVEEGFAHEDILHHKTGMRIGFGHSELVAVKLDETFEGHPLLVCAGAHKSGFLFAPVIGEVISQVL